MDLLGSEELGKRELPPIKYAVEGMIPEGYTVLSASPKIGKSWMVQQMCLAVAEGKDFLGKKTTQGVAIYFALEDCEKFAQDRQRIIGSRGAKDFKYVFDAPPMALGFTKELDKLTKGIDNLRLVVIDTIRPIEYQPSARESMVHCEYRTGKEFKDWADKREVSLIAVTHDRKADSGDPLKKISGTGGVTASADSIVMITKENRFGNEAVMGITGRRVLSSVMKIRQNESCVWEVMGDDEYEDSRIRRALMAVADGETMCAKQIIDKALMKGIVLSESSRAVGTFIVNNIDRLREDGINIEIIERGTASKLYRVKR